MYILPYRFFFAHFFSAIELYLRRFALEHWYRLAKQTLHWTVPKLSTPEQCERWSDLMPLLTWQLWLAKDVVTEIRLPQALVSA